MLKLQMKLILKSMHIQSVQTSLNEKIDFAILVYALPNRNTYLILLEYQIVRNPEYKKLEARL